MRILTAVVVSLFSPIAFASELSVRDVYIPLNPPSTKVYAAYMTIQNSGDEPRSLVDIRAAQFSMAHIHESVTIDGVASMRSLHKLEVPAGEALVMEPGGLHVMLMDPSSDAFARTDKLLLELVFADGEVVTVQATFGLPN